MRKIFSMLLCAIISLGAFTGCSSNEVKAEKNTFVPIVESYKFGRDIISQVSITGINKITEEQERIHQEELLERKALLDETISNMKAFTEASREERIKRQEAERLAKEEEERLAREEAERLAKEEEERLAEENNSSQIVEDNTDTQEIPDNTQQQEPTPQVSSEKKVSMVNIIDSDNTISENLRPAVDRIIEAINNGTTGIIELRKDEYHVYFDDVDDILSYIVPFNSESIPFTVTGEAVEFNVDDLRQYYNKEPETLTYIQQMTYGVHPGMTEREAYKIIHDNICNYLNYDYSYENYGMLETFRERHGTCNAYALITKNACNYIGIECEYVSSTNMDHAWNRVNLNGVWYYSDVCWDGSSDETVYDYYLSETLFSDHYF